MLVRVEKDGGVSEVLLYPATKVGPCLRETMLKDTFRHQLLLTEWTSFLLVLAFFFVVVYLAAHHPGIAARQTLRAKCLFDFLE
jgi:hypothetical protein